MKKSRIPKLLKEYKKINQSKTDDYAKKLSKLNKLAKTDEEKQFVMTLFQRNTILEKKIADKKA